MFTEGRHTAEFMLSEAPGSLSRDVGIIAQTGQQFVAGTVLALMDGKYVITNEGLGADAILFARADPTMGDVKATLIVRNAEVIGDALTFGSDIANEAQRIDRYTQLARLHIIVR